MDADRRAAHTRASTWALSRLRARHSEEWRALLASGATRDERRREMRSRYLAEFDELREIWMRVAGHDGEADRTLHPERYPRPCTKCGAAVGRACHTRTGSTTEPHAARRTAPER